MAYIAFITHEKQDMEKVPRHIKSYNGFFDPQNVNIAPILGSYLNLYETITT